MAIPPLIRADFPSLGRIYQGQPLVYFDGPAGTQVPLQVIDAIAAYYRTHNANTHGQFVTSLESDRVLAETRVAVAAFLGTANSSTVSFGANMTSLAFALSRTFARAFKNGDEVVITQLDHEANRGPWLTLQEKGVLVREVRLRSDGTLDESDMRRQISARTRLVCLGLASNALGTVNNVALARELSARVGAWMLLDGVHYAPHFPIDVVALQTDFLLCSAYKFYGPHVGILYCRDGLLDGLEPDRLLTQDQRSPHRIETGTQNHAALAGVMAAVNYIAALGEGPDLRRRIVTAMKRIGLHEREVAIDLYDRLRRIPGLTIYGPEFGGDLRAPTISFTIGGLTAEAVCRRLGAEGICTWDGHFYAIRAIETLGLLGRGGVTRVGISMYNTHEEARRVAKVVEQIAKHR
jgi:cysteine desulfurase family protein (TIGR01976 family)